jgi:uncharacterized protein YjeT (DUF2065 family)
MRIILKIIRSALGLVIVLIAIPSLIQGGLSWHAKYGVLPAPDRTLILLGLVMMTIGIVTLPRKPRPARKSEPLLLPENAVVFT